MNKIALFIITLALLVAIGIIFLGGEETESIQNVEIKDGVQYITVDARSGYFPRTTIAQSGIPTKLIMKTYGTFDCSSALVIKSLDYQNFLPQNTETEIDLGVKEIGETLEGVCSMGMYSFVIDFL